jgi:hypothetical protein
MGMGLSICHSIIENHNGRIRVSPGVNRGTIFQFELPAESDKHQAGTDVCGQLRLPRWVKTRNAQNEQILSGMPPEADPPEWLAQVFRSDPLNRRGSNAKLLSNLEDAGPILSPEEGNSDPRGDADASQRSDPGRRHTRNPTRRRFLLSRHLSFRHRLESTGGRGHSRGQRGVGTRGRRQPPVAHGLHQAAIRRSFQASRFGGFAVSRRGSVKDACRKAAKLAFCSLAPLPMTHSPGSPNFSPSTTSPS